MVPDSLHCLNLLLFKQFSKDLCWNLILSNAFRLPTQFGKEYVVEGNVRQLKARLLSFYKTTVDTGTRMQDFTVKMIGSENKRCFKAKGAETKSFLKFLAHTLDDEHITLDRPDVWKGCADALLGMVSIDPNEHWAMSTQARQNLFEHYMRMRRFWNQLKLQLVPKLHQAAHLVQRHQGNRSQQSNSMAHV